MKAEEAIAAGEHRLAHLRLSLSVADEGLIRDLVGALKDLAAENERLHQERDKARVEVEEAIDASELFGKTEQLRSRISEMEDEIRNLRTSLTQAQIGDCCKAPDYCGGECTCEICDPQGNIEYWKAYAGEAEKENDELRAELESAQNIVVKYSQAEIHLSAQLRQMTAERDKLATIQYGGKSCQWCRDRIESTAYAKGRADMAEEAERRIVCTGFSHCSCIDGERCASCRTVDEILEDIRALSAAVPTNQCDGCNSGMPIEDGIHQHNGHPHMCCTKGKYSAVVPVEVEL